MHRVELKDMVFVDEAPQVFVFLMHRVELKAEIISQTRTLNRSS